MNPSTSSGQGCANFRGQVTSETQASSQKNSYGYTLGATGAVRAVDINDGRPRDVTFKTDVTGQAIRRDEADTNASAGDPHSVWYRFNGREMGRITNDGTVYTDYTSSIGDRQAQSGTGAFQFGAVTGRNSAEFGIAYEAINSFSQGSAGGGYVVQAGDTLAGIAQRLYGDANLWYKIAEANGLSSAAVLVEGRTLTLPPGVSRNANTAVTFKPYDPAEALGDVSPTNPKPQKAPKCGLFGQFLVTAIAIGLSAWLGPQMISAAQTALGGTLGGAILGGAAAGATGSIVSQGFGVATGIQSGFNWKGVGMAALGGAVGGALGASGLFGETVDGAFAPGALGIKSGVVDAITQGMVSSALTQGIGVATGLQSKFDFAGVAAAGVGAGLGHVVGNALNAKPLTENGSPQNIGANMAVGAANLFANAATRSAINGNSFGDNIRAALPDAIGQIIGQALAGAALRATDNPSDRTSAASGSTNGASDASAANGNEIIVTGRVNYSRIPNPFASPLLLSTPMSLEVFTALSDRKARIVEKLSQHYGRQLSASLAAVSGTPAATVGGDSISYHDIDSEPLSGSGKFSAWFTNHSDASDAELLGYFATNDLTDNMIGSPRVGNGTLARNEWIAASLIAEGNYMLLAREIQPRLDRLAALNPDMAEVATITRNHLVAIDAEADAVVNGVLKDFGYASYQLAKVIPAVGTIDTLYSAAVDGPSWDTAIEIVTLGKGGLISHVDDLVDARHAFGDIAHNVDIDVLRTLSPANARYVQAAERAVPQVTANRLAGNAFRDEIAAALRAEGRGVQTEVYKKTPFGARYMDIEVSDVPGGTVLGGIETKLGNSRYTPSQRAKDMFLKIWENYPVNVVREPR